MQGVSCDQLQATMAQGRALTAAEWAHMDECEMCLDAWIFYGLEVKPEVRIPVDFAARTAAAMPEKRGEARELLGHGPNGTRDRHWGLITAIVLVAAGLIFMRVVNPAGLSSRMGLVFIGIVASEIAGIALWLGARGHRERWN